MSTATLTAALREPVPTASATLRVTWRALVRLCRYVILLPALTVAAARHRRASMDPASVWRSEDVLFTQPGTLDLSVVIPFYNAGTALRPTVDRLVSVADAAGLSYEVIAVSDGSTDGSERSLEGASPNVRLLVSPSNLGKGAALHRGFAASRGRYVGFVDADGDIDPEHVVDYYRLAEAGEIDVVYASKRHPESRSASSGARKVISYGFIAFVGALFALGVNDTQTGCKVFRRQSLANVLPRLREHRFAFDMEFFVAARVAGIQRMHAAPVTIRTRMAGSTVTRSAITRTLGDALTVLARLHFSPTYHLGARHGGDAVAQPAPAAALAAIPTPRNASVHESATPVTTLKAA